MVSRMVQWGRISTKWSSRACRVIGVILFSGFLLGSTFYHMGSQTVSLETHIPLDKSPIKTRDDNFTSTSCICNGSPTDNFPQELHDPSTEYSPHYVSLEEAYFQRIRALDISQIRQKVGGRNLSRFRSRFLPNTNFMQFPVLTIENICLDVNGALLLVGTSREEVQANTSGKSAIPELSYIWNEIYNCSGAVTTDNCVGVRFVRRLPLDHSYIPGNTAHLLPYIGNAMHNWAERIWPFVMASSLPIRHTVPFPINNYIIHRFEKWLYESRWLPDRAQALWQFRMLMELSGHPSPAFLRMKDQSRPVCFQKLLLQMHSRDRIDETRLPVDMAAAGVRNYREAIFKFFRIPGVPQVRLPPKKLRVLFYGRNDTSRRRIMNSEEVLRHLSSFTRPPLEVQSLDDMLTNGETNYSFPEVVRLFTRTDILVMAHGANTWSTFLLPDGAGVVEIVGPCNWSSSNYTDLSSVHTWMHVNAAACKLKHDLSNPFESPIPNPKRGNTTQCLDPFDGVPDYTVDISKLQDIIHSFAYPDRPGDRLTQHWLYDWNSTPS